MPTAPLFINEQGILASGGETNAAQQQCLYGILIYLQTNNAPLGGIGMQVHFASSSLTPPGTVIDILDRFTPFNVPIEITEFTMNFYNEEAETDYVRDFLTAIFSHLSTVGLVQWHFWPESQSPQPEHLCRLDGSIMPKGEAYLDLVYDTWRTEAHGTTNGLVRFTAPDRAFKGTYQIRASYKENSAVLQDVEVVVDRSGGNRMIIAFDKIVEVDPGYLAVEDFETGNFSTFDWRLSGDADWVTTSNEKNSGPYSAQAGRIEDSQISSLSITTDCSDGDVSFRCRVSSESGFDYLSFCIDRPRQERWSGRQDWLQVSFPVSAGTRTFRWSYSKDGSESARRHCMDR